MYKSDKPHLHEAARTDADTLLILPFAAGNACVLFLAR